MTDIFEFVVKNHYDKLHQFLMTSHPWVDIMDDNGNTPLLMASRLGHVQCVRILISHRADVLHVNRTGLNAMTLACLSGSVETIDSLLKATSIDDYINNSLIPPIAAAIFSGHKDAVQYLLTYHKPLYKTITREGNSPLMLSVLFERDHLIPLFKDEPDFLKNSLGMSTNDIIEYKNMFMKH
ncbi:hypothetical protein DMENIID0001_137330 [Sergentomyia squamirostris]